VLPCSVELPVSSKAIGHHGGAADEAAVVSCCRGRLVSVAGVDGQRRPRSVPSRSPVVVEVGWWSMTSCSPPTRYAWSLCVVSVVLDFGSTRLD
jgi:hypothetical protein